MIAGGALLGIVLAVLAKFIAGAAARARGAAARKRLKASVAAVAEDFVVEPVALEVSRLGPLSTTHSDPPQAEAGFGQSPMSRRVDEARSSCGDQGADDFR